MNFVATKLPPAFVVAKGRLCPMCTFATVNVCLQLRTNSLIRQTFAAAALGFWQRPSMTDDKFAFVSTALFEGISPIVATGCVYMYRPTLSVCGIHEVD